MEYLTQYWGIRALLWPEPSLILHFTSITDVSQLSLNAEFHISSHKPPGGWALIHGAQSGSTLRNVMELQGREMGTGAWSGTSASSCLASQTSSWYVVCYDSGWEGTRAVVGGRDAPTRYTLVGLSSKHTTGSTPAVSESGWCFAIGLVC